MRFTVRFGTSTLLALGLASTGLGQGIPVPVASDGGPPATPVVRPTVVPQADPAPAAPEAPVAPAAPVAPVVGQPAPAAPVQPEVPPEAITVVRERDPAGNIVEAQAYKNEKGKFVFHGQWKSLGPDGKPVGGGVFKHGLREGLWSRFHGESYGGGSIFDDPDYDDWQGPYLSEATFAAGQIHGLWSISDAKKRPISEWSFAGGAQHGPWVWYYPDGRKKHEAVYEAGKLHGKVVDYSPDGKVVEAVEYVHGCRKYPKVWYFPGAPDVKSVEGWYLSGLEKSKSTYDWWQGSARTVVLGVEGKDVLHGQWVWYHPSGAKSLEGTYDHGAQVGTWTWFLEDGTVKATKAFTPPDMPPAPAPNPPPPATVTP